MAGIIELHGGTSALVDEADLDKLVCVRWYLTKDGYARGKLKDGKHVSMHRHVLGLTGALSAFDVDHIDGNRLNNQRSNLRLVNDSLNQANRHVIQGGYSKFRGVTWHKQVGKWQAQIKVNGRSIYLGVYASELDAAMAYALAAKRYFGEFANAAALKLVFCVEGGAA